MMIADGRALDQWGARLISFLEKQINCYDTHSLPTSPRFSRPHRFYVFKQRKAAKVDKLVVEISIALRLVDLYCP